MPGLSQENKFRDVFNRRVIEKLGRDIATQWPSFDAQAFVSQAVEGLEDLGMNARSAQITEALTTHLPQDYPQAVEILVAALGERQPKPGKTDWDGFIVLPQCAWVAHHGKNHFDLSMQALYRMTKRFSAEGHLRVFIDLDPPRALEILHRWTQDPNPHVRRLVSEGTRPRLPMTGRIQRFINDPSPVFELLEKLKEDPSEYVRRSVANNLNDISKDNPDLVLDILEEWNLSQHEGTKWLVRHASRTLVKAGHPRAIGLLGFTVDPKVEVTLKVLSPSVQIGGEVVFEAILRSTGDREQRLLLDYVVHFVKASGKTKPKVFKWTERRLGAGEVLRLRRRQHFRPTSGRKLYPGEHGVGLKMNGVEHDVVAFQVLALGA